MGLTVYAYEHAYLTEHRAAPDEYRCPTEEQDHVLAWVTRPDFHRSLDGLVNRACYHVPGTPLRVSMSYGGHGRFRRALAATFYDGVTVETVWKDPDAYVDLPFFELVQFADNEGTIGPTAARRLADDFVRGLGAWDSADHGERPGLRGHYDEWAAAAMLAADTGIMVFC